MRRSVKEATIEEKQENECDNCSGSREKPRQPSFGQAD
jgi:hypothetical protein